MSSKHRRLRPRSGYQRPYGNSPANPAAAMGRSGYGKQVFFVVLMLAACAIVYAVTRQKSPATPAQSPTAATKPPAVKGPRADFARSYDFGRAPGDLPVDCQFLLTNTGTATLEISQVTPSCGCMKTNGWTRHIQPGQTGTVGIRLDTRHYTGNFAKSVFVTCNDPMQTNITLEIKGYIFRPLEIRPPTGTMVVNLNSEAPSNQTSMQILSHLDTPVEIFDPKSTLPNLAVELQTNQPGKEYQLIARTVPPFPVSSQSGQITLSTSMTNLPTTNFGVYINYLAAVQAFPFQLFLPPAPLPSAASVTAWARNNGTNSLAVTQATVNVNAPGVEVTYQDDPANRGIAVTANFPAGFRPPTGTNLELTIRTTHPLHPILKVPIYHKQPEASAAGQR